MLAHIRRSFLLAACVVTTVSAQVPMAAVTPLGPEYPGYVGGATLSPNGRFVIGRSDSGFFLLDRTKGRWAKLPISADVTGVVWSPDGRFIAMSRQVEGGNGSYPWIMAMDPKTGLPNGAARRISVRHGQGLAWSPDGRRIAFVAPDSGKVRVVVVPFNGGSETVVMESSERSLQRLTWTPDGRSIYMAVCCTSPRVVRLNVASGAIDSVRAGTGWAGLSRDGRYLAQLAADRTLAIALASDGTLLETVSLPNSSFGQVRWSPTAPNRLIGSLATVESNIHAVNVATGVVTEITTGKRRDKQPVYSPDGTRIAYASSKSGVAGRDRVTIANANGSGARGIDGTGSVELLRWSPDGRYVAHLNKSNDSVAIRIIDVAAGTNRELALLTPTSGGVTNEFVWRADSKAVRFVPGTALPPTVPFLYVFRVSPGRIVNEVTLDGKRVALATLADSAWQPVDGKPGWRELHFIDDTLIALMSREHMQLLSVTTGRVGRTITWPNGKRYGRGFDVTADKQWLAVGLEERREVYVLAGLPYLVSLKTGELRAIPNPLGGEISHLKIDPAGRYMVIASCPTCATKEHWDVVLLPFNGDAPRVLSAKDGKYLDAGVYSVSPDGRTVLYDAETYWGMSLTEMTLPPLKPRK